MIDAHAPLRNAVNARVQHAPCPLCSNATWMGGNTLTRISQLDGDDSPLATLAFVCTTCGFVRLHAVQPLETIDA